MRELANIIPVSALVLKLIDLQEQASAFYKFLETTFPAQPGVFGAKMTSIIFLWDLIMICIYAYHHPRTYVTVADLDNTGGQSLRPYHLPHRGDFGLRGTPDVDGTLVSFCHQFWNVKCHVCVYANVWTFACCVMYWPRNCNTPLRNLYAWMVWWPTAINLVSNGLLAPRWSLLGERGHHHPWMPVKVLILMFVHSNSSWWRAGIDRFAA